MAVTPKAKAAAKPKTATKPATKPTAKATAKPKAATAKKPSPKAVAKAVPTKGKVDNTASKVKDEMKTLKDKATDGARAAAERGKDKATEATSNIGKLIRDSASTIDEKVGTQYGDYARNAAETIEGFASKLDAKDVDDIVADAREFVRKSPAVAIGAAAAIGFVLARLVRSGNDPA